eukprot:TRINITY_DN13023_c0_g1_i1.p1 TRINITY_DN13023_c0_g1~~TRINITY_DN13023_c0_g1_i1.p1  ORF type:complete len:341 (-),score=53.20 TRINITY_DN13023_c0_g1_i1:224-1246(-)
MFTPASSNVHFPHTERLMARKHAQVDSCSSAQPTYVESPFNQYAEERSTTVLDIPDEVLAVTFSFLGPSDVASSAKVCKTFQRVIDDNYWEPRARKKWSHCLIDKYGFDWKQLYMDNNRESYTGEFLWRVPNFAHREEKKVLSPAFSIGGHPWHVLLFPGGNHDANCVAFYLKPADENTDYPMRKAVINFTVKNHRDEKKNRSRRCEHFFDRGEPDWGFTSFMRFSELKATDAGYLDGDEFVLLTELTVTPYREATNLDPDDEDAVDRVASEAGVRRAAARKAYIETRRNEHVHDMKRSEAKAIKLLKTNPSKFEKEDDGTELRKDDKTAERDHTDGDDD